MTHFIDQLRSPDAALRLDAIATLGKLRGKAGAAVPDIIDALKDEDRHVRKMTALALGDIGPGATVAVTALI